MFLTLLQRELLANLISFRFSVAVIICLLLVVTNTIVLIDDYEGRLASYNTAVRKHQIDPDMVRTYSALQIKIDRPPNPLSIFNQGLDRRLGNSLVIYYTYVPALWDTVSHSADNPFLNLLSSIDLVFIFQVILSLLALLFAYDAIAGEREDGTLRLMLTTPISRGTILLAKYIAAMICLIVPLIISLALALILFAESGSFNFSGDDWLRMGGILLTSMVYLSAFYLIGLLISTTTRRTATALMLSMLIWGTLVMVYPSLSVFVVNRLMPVDESRLKSAYREMEQIWGAFEREQEDFLKKDPVEGEESNFNVKGFIMTPSISNSNEAKLQYHISRWADWDNIFPESEKQIPHVLAFYKFIEPNRLRAAEKTWQVRARALEQIYIRKANFTRNVMRFSPAAMYDLATEAWAGTDFDGVEDFMVAAQQYRRTILRYYRDKDAFSSRQWFAVDKGAVSWDDLPEFSYQRVEATTSILRAMPDVAILFLINVGLFLAAFLIFVKQEI